MAGGVTSIVAAAALGADPMAITTWFQAAIDGLIARIQTGHMQTRALTTSYLRRHAAVSGAGAVRPIPAQLDTRALRSRMEIVGPVGFKQSIAAGRDSDTALRSMATQMAGVADETVRDGDRDTVIDTARGGGGVVGWRRRLSGRACGFCAMLASRGSVYVARQSATQVVGRGRNVSDAIRPKRAKGVHARGGQGLGEPFHPHCHCWTEPLYSHQEEPAEVKALQAQWERVTAGHSGKDAQRVWRQHWEQKATPRTQERMFGARGSGRGFDLPTPAGQGAQARQILADASSPDEVSRVLASEYERITGRPLQVDLRGSVETAREHAEGILRVVERYPEIPLEQVGTENLMVLQAGWEGRRLAFDARITDLAHRQRYLSEVSRDQARGWHPYGTPVGTSVHEMGHGMAEAYLDSDALRPQLDAILARYGGPDAARKISMYATEDVHELFAEAFADVMMNGDRAGALSREVFDLLDSEYRRKAGGAAVRGRLLPTTSAEARAAIKARQALIEARQSNASLLAEMDELLGKKADLAVFRERLADELVAPGGYGVAAVDPALVRSLRVAVASGDPAKVRTAVTAASRRAKVTGIGRYGQSVGFDPATMRSVADAEIPAGTRVTVVRRGSSVTLPSGEVVQVEPALVTRVQAPVKAAKKAVPSPSAAMPEQLHQRATLDRVYGFHDEATGLTARVVQVSGGDPGRSTIVRIDVFDSNGKKVGTGTRSIGPASRREVTHQGFNIDPSLQGQGFMTRYNAQVEQAYREHGIERVTLHAGAGGDAEFRAIGAYAWARAGYQFETPAAREVVARAARDYAAKADLSPAMRAEIKRVAANPNATPADFAAIGRTPGATTWPGKEIMLGNPAGWSGVKVLDRIPTAAKKAAAKAVKAPAKVATPKVKAPSATERRLLGAEGLSADPAVRAAQIENRVRRAWNEQDKIPGGFVFLSDIREHALLRDLDRSEVDAAIGRLARERGVRVAPLDNTKALTRLQREAALRLGDSDRHLIAFERPVGGHVPAASGRTALKPLPKVKAPPVPERMPVASLRTELHAAGIPAELTEGMPKSALADWVRTVREPGRGGAADIARIRQQVIDRRKAIGDALGDALEAVGHDASPRALQSLAKAVRAQYGAGLGDWPEAKSLDALVTAMESGDAKAVARAAQAAARRHKLTVVGGTPGKTATFDRATMQAVGDIRPGGQVVVVRPGYEVTINGERVVIVKPKVVEAPPPVAKKTPARKAPAKKAAPLQMFGTRSAPKAAKKVAPKAAPKKAVRTHAGAIDRTTTPAEIGAQEARERTRALATPPVKMERLPPRSQDAKVLGYYQRNGDEHMNGLLRRGKVGRPESTPRTAALPSPEQVQASISHMDRLMAQSELTEDITVYRGMAGVSRIFPGGGEPGSLVGRTFRDKGFVSTSADRAIASDFAVGERFGEEGVLLEVRVPRGTHAIQVSSDTFNGRAPSAKPEQEILLDRSLRYRVVSDEMRDDWVYAGGQWRSAGQYRHVVVEVIP